MSYHLLTEYFFRLCFCLLQLEMSFRVTTMQSAVRVDVQKVQIFVSIGVEVHQVHASLLSFHHVGIHA